VDAAVDDHLHRQLVDRRHLDRRRAGDLDAGEAAGGQSRRPAEEAAAPDHSGHRRSPAAIRYAARLARPPAPQPYCLVAATALPGASLAMPVTMSSNLRSRPVSMLTVAVMPARSAGSPWCGTRRNFTGRRCTTLTQFPEAFCGGRMANSEPAAGL